MTRLLFLCVSVLIVAAGGVSIVLAEVDSIEESLTAAKEKHETELETARAGVLEALTIRAASEQAAGNLDAIEATHAEIAAFKSKGDYPPSFSEKAKKAFESKLRIAAARLEEAYDDAIKQYTKDGRLVVAKAFRDEKEEFVRPTSFRQFEGNWLVQFKSGVIHTYKIAKDGDVKFGERAYDRSGRLFREKDEVLFKYEGRLERFTIVRGKLLILHYHPEGLYAIGKPPTDKGEGVLIK